jgi:hypothetical protein
MPVNKGGKQVEKYRAYWIGTAKPRWMDRVLMLRDLELEIVPDGELYREEILPVSVNGAQK